MKTVYRIVVTAIVLELLSACATVGEAPRTVAPPTFEQSTIKPAPWALVLSGGTRRGFAHVGVLKALAEEGLMPDLIVGVSAGAIVGSIAASGAPPAAFDAAAAAFRPDMSAALARPFTGLFSGTQIHAVIDQHTRQHRIEDFPIRFAAVALEAERACLQIFNRGDAGLAVQASATVPVVFASPIIESRYYLDGALISPVPVRVAYALGAERVVAVDVTFDPSERRFHSIFDAYWRTSLVMSRTLATVEASEADLVIEPNLPPERDISYANRAPMIEAGERALRAALPRIRALLKTAPVTPRESSRKALAKLLCPEVSTALGLNGSN